MKIRAFLVVSALMLLAACESPTDGFEAFYAAVADGKPDVALERLTDKARGELEQGARQANLKLEDALLGATVRSTLRRIEEVERTDDTAVIEVTDALGNTARTRMKRSGGRWRVDGDAG